MKVTKTEIRFKTGFQQPKTGLPKKPVLTSLADMLVISRIECFQVPHDDGQHVGRSQKVISEIFLTRLLATKVHISADTWLRSYGHTPTDWILITPALTAPLTIRIGPISDYPLDNTSDLSQSS